MSGRRTGMKARRPILAVAALLAACAPALAQARFDAPFFFGLATAPAQSEDGLDDVWLDWARAGKVAAYAGRPRPDDRLEFWTHPEVELDLAARAGVQVFRLGVDWGRVEPAPGVFDETAVARYREILRMIRKRKMRAMLTLMHHSVPKWAQARGGWLDDRMKDDYGAFARRMIDEFHSDAEYWVTFNEPNIFAGLAYTAGFWPPGGRRSAASLIALGPLRGATVRAMDRMSDAHDALYAWAHAKYPGIALGIAQNMAAYSGKALPGRAAARLFGELMNWRFPERIRGRMDFFGINYYGAEWLKGARLDLDPGEEYSESGRAVYPRGLYDLLTEIHRRFPGPPIVVTENGISDSTDVLRPAYLIEHLQAVARARAEGVPVAGYVFWTLSDNVEWADGYCPKFGLVAVDRARGLARVPRPSYALFREIVSARAVTAAQRRDAWNLVAARVGEDRPFCRTGDGMTPLDEPGRRKISAKDWRFR